VKLRVLRGKKFFLDNPVRAAVKARYAANYRNLEKSGEKKRGNEQ